MNQPNQDYLGTNITSCAANGKLPLTLADLPVGTKVKIPEPVVLMPHKFLVVKQHAIDPEYVFLCLPDGTCTVKAKINFLELYTEPAGTEPADQSMKQYDEATFAPIQRVLDGLQSILQYKNRQYGNSGLSPIGVFSKQDTLGKLLARADDKVARIQNSPELRKNDVVDLMGYLTLICAHQGWDNFDDQKD